MHQYHRLEERADRGDSKFKKAKCEKYIEPLKKAALVQSSRIDAMRQGQRIED